MNLWPLERTNSKLHFHLAPPLLNLMYDARGRSRKMERELITEFETLMTELIPSLTSDPLPTATELVQCFRQIRGCGPVKKVAALSRTI